MSRSLVCDICVVGGGPAGATISARLARLGHNVLLIAAPLARRSPSVQSLSSDIFATLELLGPRLLTEAAELLRPAVSAVRWGKIGPTQPAETGVRSFLIDRDPFDALFVQHAAESGVRLISGLAAAPTQCASSWRLTVGRPEEAVSIEACFVVDASGRAGWLRRARAGQRGAGEALRRRGVATLALNALWTVPNPGAPGVFLEAGSDCWYWSACLPDGRVSATVFLDPKGQGQDLTVAYHERTAQSEWLQHTLAGGTAAHVTAYSASSYSDSEVAGANWLAVGEASLCVDPLSSQGVQMALVGALQGAAVAHTILSCSANTAIALDFYHDRQREAAIRHRETASRFYADQAAVCDSHFWRVRASLAGSLPRKCVVNGYDAWTAATNVQLSKEALLTSTPCLQGDLIAAETALQHPALDRPVAYVDGVKIAPLLAWIPPGASIPMLVRHWEPLIPLEQGFKIACWLVKNRILVPAE